MESIKYVAALVNRFTLKMSMEHSAMEARGLLDPQWWWQVFLPVGVLAMTYSLFRWAITPTVLLVWFILEHGDQVALLRTLYWLTLFAPLALVKILCFPSAPLVTLVLPVVMFALSYRRIVQHSAVHPFELQFWAYWASEVDGKMQRRLAGELEKQQRERRSKKYQDVLPARAPSLLENSDRILLLEGIEFRRTTSEATENNEYYEVKRNNGEFPSENAMDCYYRSGWAISLFLLREFESNYRFCAPVRWHRNKMTGGIECTNGYKIVSECPFNSADLCVDNR
jgi:hypothetical protein